MTERLKLHFGEHQCWELDCDDGTSLSTPSTCLSEDALAGAVTNALREPIGFPSLDTAIVPGDSLVFALDPSVPKLPEILAAAIKWFTERGASQNNLSAVVAMPGEAAAADIRSHLEGLGLNIDVQAHDADDAEQLSYLAANESSDAIYLNRRLVDADVVIPITCARRDSSLDGLGTFAVFPLLSDRKTLGRFYTFEKLRTEDKRQSLRDWSEQASWWLGILASMQVIPAARGEVAQVLCGTSEQLHESTQGVLASRPAPPAELVDVVVALIDGPQYQQSWLSVARAIFSAARHVRPGGSIVVCSELNTPAGPGLKKLRETDRAVDELAKQLQSSDFDDSIAASVILEATADSHVFLASGLRKDIVESLRMGVIESEDQLARLVGSLQSCLVLGAAQHASGAATSQARG